MKFKHLKISKFQNLLLENKGYFIPYFLFVFISILLLVIFQKNELHLTLNNHHSAFLDVLFKYLTLLGEGVFLFIVLLLFLFISYRAFIGVMISYILSSAITQFLKRIVFSDIKRPKFFFEKLHDWHIVDGVELHSSFSFPSGHATTAFCVGLCAAIYVRNKKYGTVFFILSFLVAYSRIYLSQHFLRDIVAGSVIGVFIVLLVSAWNLKSTWLNRFTWIDRKLW